LKHNAIPQGILKTEQSIRPEEADAIERRWESKYEAVRTNRKVAVLGKGTSFQALSFTPEVVKLFELKRWNLYTILSKYGIPPRVANINDEPPRGKPRGIMLALRTPRGSIGCGNFYSGGLLPFVLSVT
jgi:phage portal protein BeeE